MPAIQSPPPPPSDKRTDGRRSGRTDGPTEGFLRLRERVYASGCGKERHGANGVPPVGAVNDFHDILSAKETSSNVYYTLFLLSFVMQPRCVAGARHMYRTSLTAVFLVHSLPCFGKHIWFCRCKLQCQQRDMSRMV